VEPLPLSRLLRLASPALPVGAFSYSQGLEAAIDRGWVKGEADIAAWIDDVLEFNLTRFEAPVFCRMHQAWRRGDHGCVQNWNERFLAARETAEFRAETAQMGQSLRTLLATTGEFPVVALQSLNAMETVSYPTAFSFAAVAWEIDLRAALTAYLFSWAENQVAAAMKVMRLGHVGAQRILAALTLRLSELVEASSTLEDAQLSNFTPALALASSLHETQFSRLFRS